MRLNSSNCSLRLMSRDNFSSTCHSVIRVETNSTSVDLENRLEKSADYQRRIKTDQLRHTTNSTMSVKVALLVLSVVSQCWTAPQRRNWTPQAMLYLKGAQGHGSVLERSSREEGLQSENYNQIRDGLRLSSAFFVLFELLQEAEGEGGGRN